MCRRKGVRRGIAGGGCCPALESRELPSRQVPLEQQSAAVISRDGQEVLGTKRNARMLALRRERYRNYFKYRESGRNARYKWRRTTGGLTLNDTACFSNQASLVLVKSMHFPSRPKGKKQGTGFHGGSGLSAADKQAYALAMFIGALYFPMDEAAGVGVTVVDINAGVLNKGYIGGYHNRHVRRLTSRSQQRYRTTLCPEQFNLLGTLRRRGGSVRCDALDLEHFATEDGDMNFCQNMLVNTAQPQQTKVQSMLAERLSEGGLRLLGASDVPPRSHRDVVWVGQPGTCAYLREVPCGKTAREQA